MKNIINVYKKSFKEHGDSACSVLWPKEKQAERFDALTAQINRNKFSVLDYGCGLAHMKEYIDNKYTGVVYTGVDIVSDFIDLNKKKYPDSKFSKISDYHDVHELYDYIVISGVFNIKYSKDIIKHKDVVNKTLIHLFDKTNVLLSVNFMTDRVDYKQENSYHQNISEFYNFVTENLSKRIVIDCSYMPYEYTVSIYKDDYIIRPENIFKIK